MDAAGRSGRQRRKLTSMGRQRDQGRGAWAEIQGHGTLGAAGEMAHGALRVVGDVHNQLLTPLGKPAGCERGVAATWATSAPPAATVLQARGHVQGGDGSSRTDTLGLPGGSGAGLLSGATHAARAAHSTYAHPRTPAARLLRAPRHMQAICIAVGASLGVDNEIASIMRGPAFAYSMTTGPFRLHAYGEHPRNR